MHFFLDLFSTHVAYAAETLAQFVGKVDTLIINPLIELLFALAVVYFLYGVVEFLFNQTSGEKKTSGKSHMLWGVIGITIMLGVWTILAIILNTMGISDQINVNNSGNQGNVKIQLNDYNPPSLNR